MGRAGLRAAPKPAHPTLATSNGWIRPDVATSNEPRVMAKPESAPSALGSTSALLRKLEYSTNRTAPAKVTAGSHNSDFDRKPQKDRGRGAPGARASSSAANGVGATDS